MASTAAANPHPDPVIRPPAKGEGRAMWQMAHDEAAIDLNSEYCYHLLQLQNADTCTIAWQDDQPVGYIAGTRPLRFDYGDGFNIPAGAAGNTLFIWQIVVGASQRGTGLASRMLLEILQRPGNEHLQFVQGTVIPGNTASENFFRAIARRFDCPIVHRSLIRAEELAQSDKPEFLFHIGPLGRGH